MYKGTDFGELCNNSFSRLSRAGTTHYVCLPGRLKGLAHREPGLAGVCVQVCHKNICTHKKASRMVNTQTHAHLRARLAGLLCVCVCVWIER